LPRVAAAVAFGLRTNGGATCIAPRRILAHATIHARLLVQLRERLRRLPVIVAPPALVARGRRRIAAALAAGAELLVGEPAELAADEFAPTLLADSTLAHADDLFLPLATIAPFTDDDEALCQLAASPYRLGASVFGSASRAMAFAARLDANCVTINDLIVPTADPRVPFGGRGESGFGLTRGAEGLLEMTQIKTLLQRRGNWLPHLDAPHPADAALLAAWLRVAHAATWRGRLAALGELRRAVSARRVTTSTSHTVTTR
jgi:acyl-CoA reductase-like NAD-dependent aldehyde dehydrogenase